MASITFQSNSFGRDPMELCAESQARNRRQAAEPRRDVQNSPLPEFPRRWESDWSPARQKAEAWFTGTADEHETPSAARLQLEALFGSTPC
jgi:hypothetical protein